ncbi:MAG: fasciclin domain-containing protein [Croceimicrobium sp.]|nr:fasciclin domain-containing protein [Bacteroidota bacterium]
MKKRAIWTVALIAAIFTSACQPAASDDTQASEATSEESLDKTSGQAFVEDEVSNPNILQIAVGSADHSTLVAAVQAADLENALVNAGPLMVFAPVNEAFDALPEGTVESLLKPENKDDLANILKYHVTPGNYSKEFLKKFKKLGQANDQSVAVEVKGDDVYVGGAKIIATVKASNGIIHVVDAVMLPSNN